jgi:streptogramin lyase
MMRFLSRFGAVLLALMVGERQALAATSHTVTGHSQSGLIATTLSAQIVPFGSYAVVFPTTAVGASSSQVCFYNCFGVSGGSCNYSGTVAMTKAASLPFRAQNLRRGSASGGCAGTPVTLPVTLQAGEVLLSDFLFTPTSSGSFQDTVVYTVTPAGAAADTFSWLLSGSTPASASAGANKYPTPTAQAGPSSLTLGPDGNLWFTESLANKIGRITPAGVITEFALPTPNAFPAGIAAGVDGNLWFTESDGNKIGRITPAGVVTEFPLHLQKALPGPIVAGGDGALWFAEAQYNNLAWISPSGKLAEYHLTAPSGQAGAIFALAAGSDQSIWFTENHANRVGRITRDGQFTEFNLPSPDVQPAGITLGPDGNFWFTESQSNGNARIGRIIPTGVVTEYPITTASSTAIAIVSGGGALWFSWSNGSAGKIGRMTTGGAMTQMDIPAGMTAFALAFGADGALWFTDFNGSAIGRVAVPGTRQRPARH